ncbi:MAG: AI-2E family transporter [Candidatus Saccharibacteria bacterium]|nr:AI-2E family transporter [Candidatus Saccharibacteria bacterium]
MSKKIDMDTGTFMRFWMALLAFIVVVLFILQAAEGILIICASIFLAIALTPFAKKLDQIDKRKTRKTLSNVMAVSIVVVVFVGIVAAVGPVIVDQLSKFLNKAPTEISNFLDNTDLSGLEKFLGSEDLKADIINTSRNVITTIRENLSVIALNSISALVNAITTAIFIVVLTILFMLQGPELLESSWKSFSMKNERKAKILRRTLDKMANVISIYVSRQVLVAILDGFVAGLLAFLLSLFTPVDSGFAIPVGLISAICYLIPMFGPIISSVLNALLLVVSSPLAAAIYLVVYIIYAQIEANIIAPKLQGQGLDLSPLVILVAIVLGMYAFGFIGCIIAIPIAGCIKVIIDELPSLKTLSDKNN